MKSKIVYLLTFVLVLASWAGNYTYSRLSQLPNAGFLRHYIEVFDTPSVAFDLLYVANKGDRRKLVSVTIDELPLLRFYPVANHADLRHQTIYKIIGYFDDGNLENRPASAPLIINTVNAYYSDGTMSKENIGKIIVYREAYPRSGEPPFQGSSSMGSSNFSGSQTKLMSRPATLMSTTSAWLEELGNSFQFSVKGSSRGDFPADSEGYPLGLNKGQSLLTEYKFQIPANSSQSIEVYNVLLVHDILEADGKHWKNWVFANYVPYPSESEMRAYVRAQRGREAK